MKAQVLRHRRAGLAVLALLTAGCGPTVPLNAGLDQAGANIAFGTPSPLVEQQPPPPNANPFPNFPAPLEQPPVFAITAPAGPVVLCPSAPPNAALQGTAVATPDTLPAPTLTPYLFRYQGSKKLDPGKSDERDFTLPSLGTRAVSGVQWTTLTVANTQQYKQYQFKVTESYNGITTTDTYDEYPTGAGGSAGPTVQSSRPAAGLYLAEMDVSDPGGSGGTDTFKPSFPGIELMPFPAGAGQTVTSSAVDGPDQEAMEIGQTTDSNGNQVPSQINGHASVDACGSLLDSWNVVLYGQLVNPRFGADSKYTKTFTLTLDIGTGFGGLSLSDHLVEDGTDQVSGKPFTYDVSATIDQVPLAVADNSVPPG